MKRHEEELRERESSKYDIQGPAGRVWYEAGYARGLDYYFHPKLVLQVLSRFPSFTTDLEGQFVFTAGGTAGVYGIALAESSTERLLTVAGILNSRAADFRVKQVSSVFGSRFYSYGDQFIDDIVIPVNAARDGSVAKAARALLRLATRRFALRSKLAHFPDSFAEELTEYELKQVGYLASKRPASAGLIFDREQVTVTKALYGYEVDFGGREKFEFDEPCRVFGGSDARADKDKN